MSKSRVAMNSSAALLLAAPAAISQLMDSLWGQGIPVAFKGKVDS